MTRYLSCFESKTIRISSNDTSVREKSDDFYEKNPKNGCCGVKNDEIEFTKTCCQKNKKNFFKRNLKNIFSVTGFCCLLLFFIINLIGGYYMWFTNIINFKIQEVVTFKKNGLVLNIWSNPPIPNLISVYVFNYTNTKEALLGLETLHVEEIGPFVFRSFLNRTNVTFYDNGTMTYQVYKKQEFVPELSNCTLDSIVTIPNPTIFAASHRVKNSSIARKNVVSFFLSAFSAKPFIEITIEEVFWGFNDDTFGQIAKTYNTFLGKKTPKFGILINSAGLHPDTPLIGTGIPNLENVNILQRFNGLEKLSIWDGKCDLINATDGTLFPSNLITSHSRIYVFIKDMCRKLYYEYVESDVTKQGFPVERYVIPPNIFDRPENNPENQCYKNYSNIPSGVFHAGACLQDIPVVVSFPHFLYASDDVKSGITGLKPDEKKHYSYFDIHPLGLPLGGSTRVQINLLHQKSGVNELKGLKNHNLVLPLAWIEYAIGDLNPFLELLFYHLTFTTERVRMIYAWGSIIMFILSSLVIIFYVKPFIRKVIEKRDKINVN